MYVPIKGMGRYSRRGMGAADSSEFQVVPDPTTGEQKDIYPSGQPITTADVTPSGQNVYYDASGKVISTSAPSVSSWLSANGTMLAIGGAAFLR